MNFLITICARGGSKGIPGKNIRPLHGKPLIAYSIDAARKFAEANKADIVLSTDSDEIARVSENFGLNTEYRRPSHLSDDKAGKIDTINDVLVYSERTKSIRYDYLLDLDVTSPLRTLDDLENAFALLRNNDEALTLFSVSPANRNPYFNMVEQRPDGYVNLVKKGFQYKSRQEAPSVYDVNASFYFYRRIFFDQKWQTALTENTLVYVVPHVCFDLDHPHDFVVMEVLLRENLLEFSI
jgi:CMP-N,N'-diacetyllegionaminic acid synthase